MESSLALQHAEPLACGVPIPYTLLVVGQLMVNCKTRPNWIREVLGVEGPHEDCCQQHERRREWKMEGCWFSWRSVPLAFLIWTQLFSSCWRRLSSFHNLLLGLPGVDPWCRLAGDTGMGGLQWESVGHHLGIQALRFFGSLGCGQSSSACLHLTFLGVYYKVIL